MSTDKITEAVTMQKAEMRSMLEHVLKGCSFCGKGGCPSCGSIGHTNSNEQQGQQNNQQNAPQSNQQGNMNPPASTGMSPANAAANNNVSGGGVSNMNTNPTNDPNAQLVSAADMVKSMGSALKHPVQVNHDAAGVGIHHAAMVVHPEWNQGAIKDKIDGHLKAKGWNASKNKDNGGKTYENSGHKIHVAHVGQHLIVSGQNKKGHPATPIPPEDNSPQGKKNQKKSENSYLSTDFWTDLQMEMHRTISTL